MLVNKIKDDLLIARKARDANTTKVLNTLYSEAVMIGKNDGNRVTHDNEVEKLIRKFIKDQRSTIEILEKQGRDTTASTFEIEVLENYLPEQMSEEMLRQVLTNAIHTPEAEAAPNLVGFGMKFLKENFEGLYDPQMASKILKEFN